MARSPVTTTEAIRVSRTSRVSRANPGAMRVVRGVDDMRVRLLSMVQSPVNVPRIIVPVAWGS